MSLDSAAIAGALPAYEIGESIGRGGFGVVYAGRHLRLDREVAIKQLPLDRTGDPDVRQRFAREARVLAALDHRHIVPVYDYVEDESVCLIVMERLSGGTLGAELALGLPTPERAVGVALVIATALGFAHSRGVLHRDIKPANVLLASGHRLAKVADFGTAKVLDQLRSAPVTSGDVIGTPSYMAPEQAAATEVSPATDVYALGTVAYEMLAGRLPFERRDSALAMLFERVQNPPAELSVVAPHVDTRIAEVVMSAIRTDSVDRPQSADDFAWSLADAASEVLGHGWFQKARLDAALEPAVAVAALGSASRDERAGRPGVRSPSSAELAPHRAVLTRVTDPSVALPEDAIVELQRLLGDTGNFAERVGLALGANADAVIIAASGGADRWRRKATHPLTNRRTSLVCDDVARVYEWIVATLSV